MESGHKISGKVDIMITEEALAKSDLVIDFSFHNVTRSVFETAAKLGKPIVCTTGHTQEDRANLLKCRVFLPYGQETFRLGQSVVLPYRASMPIYSRFPTTRKS